MYSGDGLLTGEDGGGTSTDVADFAGENDGTGEGVGGAASVKIISSRTSAMRRERVKDSLSLRDFKKNEIHFLLCVMSLLRFKPFNGFASP